MGPHAKSYNMWWHIECRGTPLNTHDPQVFIHVNIYIYAHKEFTAKSRV